MRQVNDAYMVLVREKKLPLSLLADPEAKRGGKEARSHLLQVQPFGSTFGKGQTRKRPKLTADSYNDLLDGAAQTHTRWGFFLSCFLMGSGILLIACNVCRSPMKMQV